jgi:hypothetical protein
LIKWCKDLTWERKTRWKRSFWIDLNIPF